LVDQLAAVVAAIAPVRAGILPAKRHLRVTARCASPVALTGRAGQPSRAQRHTRHIFPDPQYVTSAGSCRASFARVRGGRRAGNPIALVRCLPHVHGWSTTECFSARGTS
jgi:hypothetical protein